jgi:3-oxoadipate enol-lactonase
MTGIDRFLRVDGLLFRCRVDGPAGAPWLVFSNSLMTDLTLWDEQVAAFGERFRILRYDQRGHGGTEVPAGPADFDRLAQDLAGLLDAFEIASAVVVGISMGAVTALRLAQQHPARVRALVLSDGNAATPPNGAAAWDERIRIAALGGMAALVEPTVGRWFTPASLAEGGAGLAKVRSMIRRTPFDGFLLGAKALQSFDFRAGLPGIACPSLLTAGTEDGVLPKVMREMAAAMPDARFEAIEAAGHLPNIEQPAAFDRVLSAFLEPFTRSV